MLPSLLNRSTLHPFFRLNDVQREIDRLFDGAMNGEQSAVQQWMPAMDVVETAAAILCRLEVPGLAPEDIEINVEGNVVTISGEKKYESQVGENERGYRHQERRYGRFERRFTIPRIVDADAVRARYDRGVLTVELPRSEQAKPRRIAVEQASGREVQG